jgi:hypothetical protein
MKLGLMNWEKISIYRDPRIPANKPIRKQELKASPYVRKPPAIFFLYSSVPQTIPAKRNA